MLIYFALSIAFLTASIFTSLTNTDLKNKLLSQLNEKEIKYFQEIKQERLQIYFQGLALGFLISLLYLHFRKNIFVAFTILFFINYFYYILYPKSKYMVEILDTTEENQAWLEIYKHMQFKYHISFLFGLLFAFLFFAYYNNINA